MCTLARLNKRLKHLLYSTFVQQEVHFFQENNAGKDTRITFLVLTISCVLQPQEIVYYYCLLLWVSQNVYNINDEELVNTKILLALIFKCQKITKNLIL